MKRSEEELAQEAGEMGLALVSKALLAELMLPARINVLDLCWKLDFRRIRQLEGPTGELLATGVDYGYMIRRQAQRELFEAILKWREEVATQPTERQLVVHLDRLRTPNDPSPDGVKG